MGVDLLGNTWTEESERDRRRVFQDSLSLAIYSWPGTDCRALHWGTLATWLTLDSRLGPTCLWSETSFSDWRSNGVEILPISFMIHSRLVTPETATGFLQNMRQALFSVIIFINNNQIHLPLCEAGCPERVMSCVQVFPEGHWAAWGVWSFSLPLLMVAQGHVWKDLHKDKTNHTWMPHDHPSVPTVVGKGERNFSDTLERRKTVCNSLQFEEQ